MIAKFTKLVEDVELLFLCHFKMRNVNGMSSISNLGIDPQMFGLPSLK
jgi:hypothetical protein